MSQHRLHWKDNKRNKTYCGVKVDKVKFASFRGEIDCEYCLREMKKRKEIK